MRHTGWIELREYVGDGFGQGVWIPGGAVALVRGPLTYGEGNACDGQPPGCTVVVALLGTTHTVQVMESPAEVRALLAHACNITGDQPPLGPWDCCGVEDIPGNVKCPRCGSNQ